MWEPLEVRSLKNKTRGLPKIPTKPGAVEFTLEVRANAIDGNQPTGKSESHP